MTNQCMNDLNFTELYDYCLLCPCAGMRMNSGTIYTKFNVGNLVGIEFAGYSGWHVDLWNIMYMVQ